MSMIFSIWTVVVLILFIGIVIWAWSGRQKKEFEEAARIPLNDDDEIIVENEEHTDA
ncbi:MAG: cbb3-type cytochrome c oxidase subunit 3 [Gammaproteobacteria bacterium]|nr:cbb3-type cytochrome c oxidase subunit 3 [Gammaproteobacteria bacterium]